jgi:3-phenylpropionate/trans-cinnamate dioxygenase ferredoxin reductase subunit
LGEQNVLIVGGGVGTLRVAQQLRQCRHAGPITVIGAERHLPYDRPPLSKHVLRGECDSTTFPDVDELGVTWVLGTRAVSLDTAAKSVKTDDGTSYGYDVLVLALGGRPRTIPGLAAGRGIHVLRTIEDALSLREAIRATRRVIVIGAGFIGCEIAASVRQLDVEVDVIEALPAPLVRVLGPRAAAKVATLHESHGVRLHTEARVSEVLRSPDDAVRGVRLADGTEIEGADIVIGIGIIPDTAWLEGSGVELQDGIVCDHSGRTSAPSVYALGDAAQWWHKLVDGHQGSSTGPRRPTRPALSHRRSRASRVRRPRS